jgi:hypothetical protein
MDSWEQYHANQKRRTQISVKSLDLTGKLIKWIVTKTQEETCNLLQEALKDVFNKDGLEDLMLHMVNIDRTDLLEILLHTEDMCLFYCSVELNKCYFKAKSKAMKKLLDEELDKLSICDPYD